MADSPLSRIPNPPPSKCVICLDTSSNNCHPDSCTHEFCFDCLLKWTKVKPECPLCKKLFTSIIHNIQSINEYDTHLVESPTFEDQDDSDLTYLSPVGSPALQPSDPIPETDSTPSPSYYLFPPTIGSDDISVSDDTDVSDITQTDPISTRNLVETDSDEPVLDSEERNGPSYEKKRHRHSTSSSSFSQTVTGEDNLSFSSSSSDDNKMRRYHQKKILQHAKRMLRVDSESSDNEQPQQVQNKRKKYIPRKLRKRSSE